MLPRLPGMRGEGPRAGSFLDAPRVEPRLLLGVIEGEGVDAARLGGVVPHRPQRRDEFLERVDAGQACGARLAQSAGHLGEMAMHVGQFFHPRALVNDAGAEANRQSHSQAREQGVPPWANEDGRVGRGRNSLRS